MSAESLKKLPQKAGFYWARSSNYEWWNLFIEVHGEAPFFKIRGWHRMSDKFGPIDPNDIAEFGPEIIQPAWKKTLC